MWPQRVWFLPHFGLKSGMVFEGATVVYERINRFRSKWVRKRVREICEFGMHFLEVFFCCCSNLSNDDIISKRSGLKMGMDFRGQVWKRVWKMTFIYRTGWHTPTKNSQEYPWGCGRVTLEFESIFLSRVEGGGFHVEGEGTMSRVEGKIFSFFWKR